MKRYSAVRIAMMLFSMIPMSFGVTLFTLSGFGNDPFTGMNMALAAFAGLSFGTMQLLVNAALFLLVLIFERKLFGFGTIINMVSIGYLVDFFKWLWKLILPVPDTILPRVLLLAAGVLVLSLGAALYFTADMGVAPYDSTAFLLSDRTPLPYAPARMLTDIACVIVCVVFGGGVGLGTLVSALCLGPFITFFRIHCSERILAHGEKAAKGDDER